MIAGGTLREFTDEESNFAIMLQRAMEMDGVDKSTLHYLVTLLLKVRKLSCTNVYYANTATSCTGLNRMNDISVLVYD